MVLHKRKKYIVVNGLTLLQKTPSGKAGNLSSPPRFIKSLQLIPKTLALVDFFHAVYIVHVNPSVHNCCTVNVQIVSEPIKGSQAWIVWVKIPMQQSYKLCWTLQWKQQPHICRHTAGCFHFWELQFNGQSLPPGNKWRWKISNIKVFGISCKIDDLLGSMECGVGLILLPQDVGTHQITQSKSFCRHIWVLGGHTHTSDTPDLEVIIFFSRTSDPPLPPTWCAGFAFWHPLGRGSNGAEMVQFELKKRFLGVETGQRLEKWAWAPRCSEMDDSMQCGHLDASQWGLGLYAVPYTVYSHTITAPIQLWVYCKPYP